MKKYIPWICGASLLVFAVAWGVMGIKIFSGEYDITAEAWVGLVCLILLLGCALYRKLSRKCPHCGKMLLTDGHFCPYCGKEIQK